MQIKSDFRVFLPNDEWPQTTIRMSYKERDGPIRRVESNGKLRLAISSLVVQ